MIKDGLRLKTIEKLTEDMISNITFLKNRLVTAERSLIFALNKCSDESSYDNIYNRIRHIRLIKKEFYDAIGKCTAMTHIGYKEHLKLNVIDQDIDDLITSLKRFDTGVVYS